MANFMKFKVDANKDLHLNVENVYRVGLEANTPTDADLLFYYNVASAAGTNVWAAKVKLASAITQLKATQLEALVRKVNQRPGGIVEAKDVIGDTVFLAAAAPFAVASTAQPS
jgi:hypothetical protein